MAHAMITVIRAACEEYERQARDARKIEMLVAELVADGIALDELDVEAIARGIRGQSRKQGSVRRAPKARPRAGSRNPSSETVRAFVLSQPSPVSRADVQRQLGGTLDSIGRSLQGLARAGRIEAVGKYGERRYEAPSPICPTQVPKEHSAPISCNGPDDMLALIVEHGALSAEQLHELTGAPIVKIAQWGNALACRAEVVHDGEGRTRRWRPAGRRVKSREVV